MVATPPGQDEIALIGSVDSQLVEASRALFNGHVATFRRIADALARGSPLAMEDIREAVRKGVRASGRFEAPLVLLEGESLMKSAKKRMDPAEPTGGALTMGVSTGPLKYTFKASNTNVPSIS